MPSLLSPRGATTKAPTEDDSIVKKPIGVMGRLKSTFKLGRRKSSSGSASSSAAAAATAMVLDDKNDEPAVSNDDDEEKARNDQDDDVHETFTVEKDEIKPFTTVDDDNEAKPEVNLDDKNDRVATFELSTAESTPMDENEEVFACDYSSGQGPHVDDATLLDDEEVDDHFDRPGAPDDSDRNTNSGNQSRDVGAPPESDLMIVGVSPTKLPAPVTGPSLSPVKRSQPPREKEQTPAPMGNQDPPTGPSQVDTEPSLGDRVTSAHSTRPIRQLSDSPVRRLQLLSDFQFGTDGTTATTSPAPLSPMKRRAQAAASLSSSLPTRRSFQREHEGHPSINATHPTAASPSPAASPAKAQRKPDTPSTMPSVRAVRSERRSALHGITEEDTEATRRPRPAGGSRRRGASMEAPFLASSFVATPEVPEDPSTVMENEQPEAAVPHDKPLASTTEDETGPGAFAFDAGAAITTVFGERVARLLGADPWGDRQDGFDAIVYQLKKTDLATAKNRRELFCAALAAVQCGVDDRVAPVMYCALDTLRSILKEFATILDRSFLKYQPTNEQLSGLTKAIIGKLGDSNKRTQREASQAIVRLAKLKKLKVLPHVLLHLSAKEVVPRQRVETLRLLVKELGTEPSTALNVEVVMQFAVPVLKIAEEKTRKAAVELIAELHLIHDQAVNAQLTGVKPEMLRVINRRVDELLTQRESERQAQQAQQTTSANQEDDRTTTMALVAVPVEDTAAVQTLLESMHTQAQGVVGPVVWRKLESKTWSDRKEALVDVEKTITEAKSDLRDVKPTFQSIVQHNFIAYCTVVHRCLSDGIAPVVNSAMDTFVTLMKIYGPCVEWREDTVQDLTLLTIVRLFGTMQKPNARTNRAACRCLLKLARLHSPHPLRYVVSCVFAKDTDPLVQMHLLRLLIPEFGFQSEGLSPHDVLGLVATALNHSNDKVRKTATDVALCTQRLVGKDTVLQKLTDVVKPVTLKELEKQFVELEIQKDTDRPQTVHATTLPPVQLNGERRLLNSAPVGVGKLQCTPLTEDESESYSTPSLRRASVLSHDEENLMDAILGGDDF